MESNDNTFNNSNGVREHQQTLGKSLQDVVKHEECTSRLKSCVERLLSCKRVPSAFKMQHPTHIFMESLATPDSGWWYYEEDNFKNNDNNQTPPRHIFGNYEKLSQIVFELESNWKEIQREYLNLWENRNNERQLLESIHSNVSEGSWNSFYFYKQGKRNDVMHHLCPKTSFVLENNNLGNLLMRNCSMGYAYFSILDPNTIISSHCGPSNLRLRIHLTLVLPSSLPQANCQIRVGNLSRPFKQAKCFVFDDSFEHQVVFKEEAQLDQFVPLLQPSQPNQRVVLLVDIFHPDLTGFERQICQDFF